LQRYGTIDLLEKNCEIKLLCIKAAFIHVQFKWAMLKVLLMKLPDLSHAPSKTFYGGGKNSFL